MTIAALADEIQEYFEYLKRNCGYHVAFHNRVIPLGEQLEKLAPYCINCHPYCLYVKSNQEVWDRCVKRQRTVFEHCTCGMFFGTCYAGMGEVTFPIEDFDKTLLGYISVSGYEVSKEIAQKKRVHFARRYEIDTEDLERLANLTLLPLPDLQKMETVVAPLCRMFTLLFHATQALFSGESSVGQEEHILSHAVVFLRRHYAKKIRVEDVAAYCHCSVSTISHHFKQRMGLSIPSYLAKLRLENAKMLLVQSELSVSRIADAMGFHDPNYFCKVFKGYTGLTPSQLRADARMQELQQTDLKATEKAVRVQVTEADKE